MTTAQIRTESEEAKRGDGVRVCEYMAHRCYVHKYINNSTCVCVT